MSAAESTPGLLAWIDLETTGLDPEQHTIAEAALVLTGPARPWTPLRRATFLVAVDPEQQWDAVAHEMAVDSGLADALDVPEACAQLADVDLILATMIEECRPARFLVPRDATGELDPMRATPMPPEVWAAGSGVAAFDRRFIERHMPALDRALSYRTLDVGQIRRALRISGMELSDRGPVPHRALPDVLRALDEWREIDELVST